MLQVSFVIALLYLSGNWPEFRIEFEFGKRKIAVDPMQFNGFFFTVYSFWHIAGLFVTKFFQGQ